MTAGRLLADVQSRGVQVWVEGSLLRLRARKGVVDPDTIARISAYKAEIISILTGKGFYQARVRGTDIIEQVPDAEVCWHCKGLCRAPVRAAVMVQRWTGSLEAVGLAAGLDICHGRLECIDLVSVGVS
jgi:hypothetical protein